MALPATEDFVGSAGALSGSWTQQKTVTLNRDGSGNAVSSSGTDEGFAYWNADTFDDDQYSEAVIGTGLSSGLGYAQITVRATGTTDATRDFYGAWTDGASGLGHTEIARVDNGSATILKGVATTFSTGDTIRLEVEGNVLTLYKNGTQVDTTTDSTYTSGHAGAGAYGTAKLASWEAGNIAAGFSRWQREDGGFWLREDGGYWLREESTGTLGTTYSDGVTESLSAAESETVAATFAGNRTESGTAADSETATAVMGASRSEALTASDSETGAQASSASRSDSLTAADSETVGVGFAVARSETVSAADSETGNAAFPVARAESLSVADSEDATTSTGPQVFNVSVTESLTTADLRSAQAVYPVSRTESGSATDSLSSAAFFAGLLAEQLATGESLGATASMFVDRGDLLALSESAAGDFAPTGATYTFEIQGGPVVTLSIIAGPVLSSLIEGGPVLTGSMSGGPV